MIVKTTDMWLASYWLGGGRHLIASSGVEDRRNVSFVFEDVDGREPELTEEFFSHEGLQAMLRCGKDLRHALYRARNSPSRRCTAAHLAAERDRRWGPREDGVWRE